MDGLFWRRSVRARVGVHLRCTRELVPCRSGGCGRPLSPAL